MSADFIVHLGIAMIGRDVLFLQRISLQHIPNGKRKIKWIHRFGIFIWHQRKCQRGICLLGAGKFQISAKAVLGDVIFFSADCVRFVFETADNRKQHRRVPRPNMRVCLPDIFYAGLFRTHRAQLGALAVDADGKFFILNRVRHSFSFSTKNTHFPRFSLTFLRIFVNRCPDVFVNRCEKND